VRYGLAALDLALSGTLKCKTGVMAEPRTGAPSPTAPADSERALERADDRTAIERVSAARRAGDEDPEGVEELLRRAADRNRAALDRLAR